MLLELLLRLYGILVSLPPWDLLFHSLLLHLSRQNLTRSSPQFPLNPTVCVARSTPVVSAVPASSSEVPQAGSFVWRQFQDQDRMMLMGKP